MLNMIGICYCQAFFFYYQLSDAVNLFQDGKIPLLLASYGACSLGFTLHRATNIILLDRPWTPGDVAQAEDRCHRLGMNGSLKCHWFKLGLLDDLVDSLLVKKNSNIDLILHQGMQTDLKSRKSFSKLLNSYIEEFSNIS